MSFIYLEPVDMEGSPSKKCRCVPAIPPLTYGGSWVVWKDRVESTFKYYSLHDLLAEDPPPPPSSSETAAWESRRMRAAILLKSALSDEILQDMVVLSKTPGAAPGLPDDPREIFEKARYLIEVMLAGESTRIYYAWDLLEDAQFSSPEDFVSRVKKIRALRVAHGEAEDEAVAVAEVMRLLHRHFPALGRNVERIPWVGQQWFPFLKCILGMAAAATTRSEQELTAYVGKLLTQSNKQQPRRTKTVGGFF